MPTKPPRPKKTRIRNPVQTRAKLLEATSELLARGDHARLSMKEAARLAKVSRAAAYQHFSDRDHLLREAKSQIVAKLLESMASARPATMDDYVNHVAEIVLNNVEAARQFVADALGDAGLNRRHPLYKELLRTLRGFKARKESRPDMDVEAMAFIMLGSVATLIMMSRLRDRHSPKAIAERFTREWTNVLRNGIFRAAPRPARRRKI